MAGIPLEQIINSSIPIGTAVIGYLLGQFLPGFTKEWFDERARVKKHRLEVARHVLRICIEAISSSYRRQPRDLEDVHSVQNDLEGVDKDMSKILAALIYLWIDAFNAQLKLDFHSQNTYKKTVKEAEEKRLILSEWANKVRNGK